MESTNAIHLLGEISDEPRELDTRANGGPYIRFTLKHVERWDNNEGPQEKRNYFCIQAQGGMARVLLDYGRLGKMICLMGSLRTWPLEGGGLEAVVHMRTFNFISVASKRRPLASPVAYRTITVPVETDDE